MTKAVVITAEEQKAIDEWLAKNSPKKIPQGKVYYDEATRSGWEDWRQRDWKAKERQRRFQEAFDKDRIAKLASEGKTDREISEALGLGMRRVFELRKKFGIKAGFKPFAARDKVLDMLGDEWIEATRVAEGMGRSASYAREILKELFKAGKVQRREVVHGNLSRNYEWRRCK
jgi:hypothetical protein